MKVLQNIILVILLLVAIGLWTIGKNSTPIFFIAGLFAVYLLYRRGLIRK